MARKRNLNICKVRPDRFRDMTADQLINVWKRLGASAPAHRKVNQKVKALVVALAVAKNQHKRGAKPPHGEWRVSAAEQAREYNQQADRLISEIYDLQQKAGCVLPENEFVARDAERQGDVNVARKLRRKAIIR